MKILSLLDCEQLAKQHSRNEDFSKNESRDHVVVALVVDHQAASPFTKKLMATSRPPKYSLFRSPSCLGVSCGLLLSF